MSSINLGAYTNPDSAVTVGGTIDANELTTKKVYGTPTPVQHFTINGTTESTASLSASTIYLLQAPDYEIHFKLHPVGDTPGALYIKVHANTDFPFTSSTGTPGITVSGTSGSSGTAVLVSLS